MEKLGALEKLLSHSYLMFMNRQFSFSQYDPSGSCLCQPLLQKTRKKIIEDCIKDLMGILKIDSSIR